jgi:hypothetical protein
LRQAVEATLAGTATAEERQWCEALLEVARRDSSEHLSFDAVLVDLVEAVLATPWRNIAGDEKTWRRMVDSVAHSLSEDNRAREQLNNLWLNLRAKVADETAHR